jgi:hypothetical protein
MFRRLVFKKVVLIFHLVLNKIDFHIFPTLRICCEGKWEWHINFLFLIFEISFVKIYQEKKIYLFIIINYPFKKNPFISKKNQEAK